MKRVFPAPKSEKFKGNMRLHQNGGRILKTWDEWVEGKTRRPPRLKYILKVVGISMAIIILIAILWGLTIELS